MFNIIDKIPEPNKKIALLFLNINLIKGTLQVFWSPGRVAAYQYCCETGLKLARHLWYFGIV